MRAVGLDIHREFCEVAISEGGEVAVGGSGGDDAGALGGVRSSLGPDDRVALEVRGNAWEIARIIEPHVAQVWS